MDRQQFRSLFASIESQMHATLEQARAKHQHSSLKGDAAEQATRELLRDYLPRSLGVGYGEVIDQTGRRSSETDVVVTSPDHPGTFRADKAGIFLIEAVLAAGEVKSVLTSHELTDAISKATRFKALQADQPPNSYVLNARDSDMKRFQSSPPWFLLGFESQLRLETIREKLRDCSTVDAVFVLGSGWTINVGDGQGAFAVERDGNRVTGWAIEETDAVPFSLIAWLSTTMVTVVNSRPVLSSYLLDSVPPPTGRRSLWTPPGGGGHPIGRRSR